MLLARPPLRPSRANACRQCLRRLTSDAKVFKKGDNVLIKVTWPPKEGSSKLIPKLDPSVKLHTHNGIVDQGAFVGKRIRDTVRTNKGITYRLFEPTLDEYVRFTSRIVTPIYADDANLIVSLLDIHATPPTPGDTAAAPFEILEAGTGHGSLTLHLARAIHAYNPPRPAAPSVASESETSSTSHEDANSEDDVTYESTTVDHTADVDPLEAWQASRRAILHTLEIKPKHAKHARKVVRGFRNGLYAGNVDFHISDVSDFLHARFEAQRRSGNGLADAQNSNTRTPFLSHAILDLASADDHLALVSDALRVNGTLLVFNPSITQIVDCVQRVKELGLPFSLETVVELKGGDTLRKWKIHAKQARKVVKKAEERTEESAEEQTEEPAAEETATGSEEVVDQVEQQKEEAEQRDQEQAAKQDDEYEWKTVCRPEAGALVGVGGFVGVWRRIREDDDARETE